MKKFLPLIIVILIAIIFSILALYTSNILTSGLKVVEGNTAANPVDCVTDGWNEWSACDANGEQTLTPKIITPASGGGNECPADIKQYCALSSSNHNQASDCTRPDLTGYMWPTGGEEREKDKFQINGLQCDSDNNYYGSPTAESCNTVNTPYSLKGCHKILIEVQNKNDNGNANLLIVNFDEDVFVTNEGELKNNFQYKVVGLDMDYKNVSEAPVTGAKQIKLKIDKDIAKDQSVLVKYNQIGRAELKIGSTKINTLDPISVINNIEDFTPPRLRSIVVRDIEPKKITLLFNEQLKENSLNKDDFDITVNGHDEDGGYISKPNNVTVKNKTLIIDLIKDINKGDKVEFKYTKNANNLAKQLKDINNNSLLDINVTAQNNVGFPSRDMYDTTYTPSSTTGKGTSETWDQMYNRIYGRSNYGPDEESYYNEQYIKSIGAHNPFKYMNDKANIKCRVDPMNKSRAICDLGRNFPIQQYNLDELEDNRGNEKDKYILKTKIVPAVNPRCPTCLDEDDFNSELKKDKKTDNPLALNDSVKKLLNIQDNISLDKFVRTIKTNPNLKINENLKNDLPNINMPQLNNNLKNELPNINMPQLNNNLKNELPNINMPQLNANLKNDLPNINIPQLNNNLQPNIQDSSNFNAPQTKTQQFNNVLDNPMFNTGLKTPKLNANLANQVSNVMNQGIPNAADVVNIDPRILNENVPTPLIHEMGNVKTTNPSSGFIPRLTSFSSF